MSDIKARSAELVARFEALPFSTWHLKLAILAGIGVLFDAVNLALFGRGVAAVCAKFGRRAAFAIARDDKVRPTHGA